MLLQYGGNNLSVVEYELEFAFGKKDVARVFVLRPDFDESQVQRGVTSMYVKENTGDTRFGGILRDYNRQGATVEIRLDSFERLAEDAEPSSSDQRFENVADYTIVEDAIDSVSGLSKGSTKPTGVTVSFTFSHASQAYKIREVERDTGREVVFRSDKSVDYLASGERGSNKSIELSPENQNVTGNFEAEKKAGDSRVSHLRVIGAGEGRHQLTSELVASWYSESDRQVWRVVSNKDITSQNALDSYAETLIDELNEENALSVRTTIENVNNRVRLGDEFRVVNNEEGVDSDLRVVELTERYDSEGFRYDVVLSNRKESRSQPSAKQRLDSSRYNRAFEGNSVSINSAGGRQPVAPDSDYLTKIYYPSEVEFEHRLNLRLMGLPYRAYSQGGASNNSSTANISPQSFVVDDSTSSTSVTFTYPNSSDTQ